MDGNSLWLVTVITLSKGINVCINRALVESFPDTDIRKGLFLTESAFLPAGKTFEEVIYTDDDDINYFTDETAYLKASQYTKGVVAAGCRSILCLCKFKVPGYSSTGCWLSTNFQSI